MEVGGGKGAGHVDNSNISDHGWGGVMTVDLDEEALVEVNGVIRRKWSYFLDLIALVVEGGVAANSEDCERENEKEQV